VVDAIVLISSRCADAQVHATDVINLQLDGGTYQPELGAYAAVMPASAGITLPPPVALARSVERLADVPAARPVAEPKWDGWRAVVCGGRIWGRTGTDLTRFFPDLAPVLAARLPPDAVVDGELVAWDVAEGRLDFLALQARLTAGSRIHTVAPRRPAQFVGFDLLAAGRQDLRALPLAERRRRLESLLADVKSPIVLCQQVDNLATAQDWLTTLTAAGIEGVLVKDARSPYPTLPDRRVWWKVKARHTLDLVVVGVIGELSAPTSLVLAWAGEEPQRRAAGVTTVLPRSLARRLAPLLEPTGATWQRRVTLASAETSLVQTVVPVVVEVSADTAVDAGVLRHPARLVRLRPDLEPAGSSTDVAGHVALDASGTHSATAPS
jgi:ATP-dependent DNA ligase